MAFSAPPSYYSLTGNVPADFSMSPLMLETLRSLMSHPPTVPIPSTSSPAPEPQANAVLVARNFTGYGNNYQFPGRGSVDSLLARKIPAVTSGGALARQGPVFPSPRHVSNIACKATGLHPSLQGHTNMVWLWGQFVDHELDLTPTQSGGETADILTVVDAAEDYPGRVISFSRSIYSDVSGQRQHPNIISAFLDATNVYGCCHQRALALRRLDGTGRLLTSRADNGEVLLPKNTMGLDNAQHGLTASAFFVAGDIRANENIFLTAMHTLFMREHNRWCDVLLQRHPHLRGQDEIVYQLARHRVIALEQHITYSEFLDAILGPTFGYSETYDSSIDPSIQIEFSTAAYRVGHAMIPSSLVVDGQQHTKLLRDCFFDPATVTAQGIDSLLEGAYSQKMQEITGEIVDDLRNFLFDSVTVTHLTDLASLNIQRGRDHSLPDYNTLRQAYGLPRVSSLSTFPGSPEARTKLGILYQSIDDLDPWVGGILETHMVGTVVGPFFFAIIAQQFRNLAKGDRYWWKRDPMISDTDARAIGNTRLSDVIRRNTSLLDVRSDVFRLPV